MLKLMLLNCCIVHCYQMKRYCKVLADIITAKHDKNTGSEHDFSPVQLSHKVPLDNNTGYCEKYVDVFLKRVTE